MYQYVWDAETGGLLLTSEQSKFSKEPRPVYYKELDILGFDQYWSYPKDDSAPIMWAEASNYFYRGKNVAKLRGGSLYSAPEIIVLEDPEPNGDMLQLVDIPSMVSKNRRLLEPFIQETIQIVYNTYRQYKGKVDLFYVAFSGGKDSVVTLDIVQRALPHDEFMVLFGDTQMEFSDTYDVIEQIEEWCKDNNIRFEKSKSQFTPDYTWDQIGPPAQKMRWCCGVHKTAPQIILLREITKNPQFRGMAMMGVRAEESVSRSCYGQLNFGTKHQGQYDFYPILRWNTAELFLYIYQEGLILNQTYKKGNSRAGCLVCPMTSKKNEWFREQSYSGDSLDWHTTSFYNKVIVQKTIASELSSEHKKELIEMEVWKSRHNGTKLSDSKDIYHEERSGNTLTITLDSLSVDWKEWLKTLGDLNYRPNGKEVEIYCDGQRYVLEYWCDKSKYYFRISEIGTTQKEIHFASWLKIALRKSAYCITCRVCEANCPNGFIHMGCGTIQIDDRCVKCKKCYEVDDGCVVAASHRIPKEGNKMNGSINQYKSLGVRYEWVSEYFSKKDGFWEDNNLGSMMITPLKAFLRHAGVTEKNKITVFGEIVATIGVDKPESWALMLCNFVYSPQFFWWVNNIMFNRIYTAVELDEMLKDAGLTKSSRNHTILSFKNIFYSNHILGEEVGLGNVTIKTKGKNSYLIDVQRTPWSNPNSCVILYSLYKFAEACGEYYQFTLDILMDDSIERDGVSPTRIFGLDRETMGQILNGLAINYPEFISVTFTLGLDNITLRAEKTSADVLQLF